MAFYGGLVIGAVLATAITLLFVAIRSANVNNDMHDETHEAL